MDKNVSNNNGACLQPKGEVEHHEDNPDKIPEAATGISRDCVDKNAMHSSEDDKNCCATDHNAGDDNAAADNRLTAEPTDENFTASGGSGAKIDNLEETVDHPDDTLCDNEDTPDKALTTETDDKGRYNPASASPMPIKEELLKELDSALGGEESRNYDETQSKLETTIGSLRELMLTVRKGAFNFQKFTTDFNDLINQSGWTRKEFDVIGIYQNPEDGEIARDWFESISRSVDLVNKSMNGEVEDSIGRIPPRTFRACLKLTSRFDPILTLPTFTPMYRLKRELPDKKLSEAIQRCVSGFYTYAKWILSTEKRITAELIGTLRTEEKIKEADNRLVSSTKKKLSRIHDELSTYVTLGIEPYMLLSPDDKELVQVATQRMIEDSRDFYDMAEEYSSAAASLKKAFFKNDLSDLYKLFNDLEKTFERFNTDTKDIKDSEDKALWVDLLLRMKSLVEEFLGSLDIYKNPEVVENATVWNDTMDYVEVIDAEDDDSHENGMVSEVHKIGFSVSCGDGQKYCIEKTRVSVYRNSKY